MSTAPRVLVLEDEPLIAMMVQEWLEELGCETVGPAHSVPTALDLIAKGSLDGAILDVSIGSGDSTAVADALRQKGVPYALATGRAGGKLVAEYGKAPSLLKPYDFADVRGVMAQILGPHSGP